MRCPFCDAEMTRVIDSRLTYHDSVVRRRRKCSECGKKFTTYEEYREEMSVKENSGSED